MHFWFPIHSIYIIVVSIAQAENVTESATADRCATAVPVLLSKVSNMTGGVLIQLIN